MTEAIPVRQWVVHGTLPDIQADLQSRLDDLQLGITMEKENDRSRSGREVDFCLSSKDWGYLGSIHLVTFDPTQILLAIFLPLYPSEEEVLVYESHVRDAIPPPKFALRISEMYGPEKVREYLQKILHQLRLQTFDRLCQELPIVLGGISVEKVKLSDNPLTTPSMQPGQGPDDHQKGYPENILAEGQSSIRDIPASEIGEQQFIHLWKEGRSAKDIAQLTGKTEKTVYNRISLLRKDYGEQAVPRRKK